jgi:DNA-binding NarL/FixJ family response regulator
VKENFLLVEDHAQDARDVSRELAAGHRRVAIAETVDEARAVSQRLRALTGAIVDLGLPDGTGFDVVRYLRSQAPGLPVLVITSTKSPELANLCQLLGVEFAYKPTSRANLRAFAERASWTKRLTSDRLARHIAVYAREHGLTRREQDVLGCAVLGCSRKEIAEALERTENSVKMQIRSLLKKTDKPSLGALVTHVLRDVWLSGEP